MNVAVVDLGGATGVPMAQIFLNFMQFFGKIWQNRKLVPPPGVSACPGFAPVWGFRTKRKCRRQNGR